MSRKKILVYRNDVLENIWRNSIGWKILEEIPNCSALSYERHVLFCYKRSINAIVKSDWWILFIICVSCVSVMLSCLFLGLTSLLSCMWCFLVCFFVTLPNGVLGEVWYLIVSIPDLCLLPYFTSAQTCSLMCRSGTVTTILNYLSFFSHVPSFLKRVYAASCRGILLGFLTKH